MLPVKGLNSDLLGGSVTVRLFSAPVALTSTALYAKSERHMQSLKQKDKGDLSDI